LLWQNLKLKLVRWKAAMQTVLITGANRGLGLEHTRQFLARGDQVIALVREPSDAPELDVLALRYPAMLSLHRYDALDELAPARIKQALGAQAIDVLFANAGANGAQREMFGAVSANAVQQLTLINAIAPLKLCEALIDNVATSQRKLIAFQSSLMGSVADNGSGGHYAYRISKAAMNMVAKNIANDVRARGVIAVALHPGWVQTRMGGAQAPVALVDAVSGQQALLSRLTLADTGGFFNFDGATLPW
jgi:NAD(P)-dependent dehydrogenase (short-subunit alcohol dehydrogenase family)